MCGHRFIDPTSFVLPVQLSSLKSLLHVSNPNEWHHNCLGLIWYIKSDNSNTKLNKSSPLFALEINAQTHVRPPSSSASYLSDNTDNFSLDSTLNVKWKPNTVLTQHLHALTKLGQKA